ncbi:ABC-type transporter, periplasmic subunit [Pseudonocardia dioxanivorans CB1190]|uniref:ABC-type transporter, periplasmic subunit n=1 Tax=Pseudonocardia dioxanivorans (strain ATCC 55486 / DSM 44775 / JCM 13855 / CB1190) TaxID=675635 RepID=F4CNP3_PSEUX|nr:ABC transporter substrate-binding protein [Pseudonocardia dioxanivorans]AEA22356.1 ABC-type transporter, periplasmic subunit [Pseudonocardia dioxanivorans CB1190]
MPVSRRSFLAGVAGAGALATLAACANGGAGGAPQTGGRLRAAFVAGGAQETLDPHRLPQFMDQARAKACFDTLGRWEQDMSCTPRLAESWEPDATGTRWRIRLRQASFHDGRPVRATDVLYTYRRIADPATTASAAALFTGIDFAASRAVNDRELEIVLGAPNHLFPVALGSYGSEIIPEGTTSFAAPVGSGPFRFVSFTPGGPALYRRNDAYWDGAPALDELEFLPVADESARVGALLSGQIEYAHDIRATSAQQLASDSRTQVLTAPGAAFQFLYVKHDRPPFDDPRLRQALVLGLDREALARVALLGRGQPGNDMFGKGLQYYPDAVPQRTRDVDRAKALVAESGVTTVELSTGVTDPSWPAATQLIVAQLAEIGLTAQVRNVPPETYFADVRKNATMHFSRTGTLPVQNWIATTQLSSALTNSFSKYVDPEIDRLHAQALADPDEGARAAAIGSALTRIHDNIASPIWGISDWIVGVHGDVKGLQGFRPNTFDWANFAKASLG